MLPKRTPPQSLLSRALLASASTKQHHQIRQKATQQTSYIVPNTPKTDFPAPVQQSPNRAEPWSRTQARKSQVAVGPRYVPGERGGKWEKLGDGGAVGIFGEDENERGKVRVGRWEWCGNGELRHGERSQSDIGSKSAVLTSVEKLQGELE
ncbi:hypothetical protein HK097_002140 [Rhizophlyctis rosea]|uniref:Uncharacterized protein n=1 Tax=Rhizophlyctis rosea TaxID=64517 RepID=A0AAD5X1F2_9FUNG|nr:hypothetical protein HK097_002140 [Rhizophlyctis rosea]